MRIVDEICVLQVAALNVLGFIGIYIFCQFCCYFIDYEECSLVIFDHAEIAVIEDIFPLTGH